MRRNDARFEGGPNYGSAREATEDEIRPHLDRDGDFVGYHSNGRIVTYGWDEQMPAGVALLGGAGSGKTTSFYVHNIVGLNRRKPRKRVVLDIKNGAYYILLFVSFTHLNACFWIYIGSLENF